jgi:hypothetical protein
MMYVEQYAQQRLNEQQADREREWRRIAEHWNEDARTVRASKWAVVRLFERIAARRRKSETAMLPDGARPQAEPSSQNSSQEHAGRVTGAPAAVEPLWPEGSIVGRFAECAGQSSKATVSAEQRQRKELATTR